MKNLQSEWARLLIASLAASGVRDAVLSPGSRSTPFVLAAARQGDLRCHDVIDERSAAFFALGQARVTGRPSLLLCTSGTAGANYLPAVLEAEMAFVPLLILTADRPVDLVGCGANQTVDQLKLFGDHVRRFFDLGQGDAAARALRALRRQAAQAVLACLHPEPGPVHLNARAKKPLEPHPAVSEAEKRLRDDVDALLRRPAPRTAPPDLAPSPMLIDALSDRCRAVERGLIVAGPAPLSQARDRAAVAELSRRTGFPVLADPASQLRFGRRGEADALFVDAFSLLLGNASFRDRHPPDLIVQLGRAPTAGSWERYLERHPDREHWLLGPHGFHDPLSTAGERLIGEIGPALRHLAETLPASVPEWPWRRSFREAQAVAEELIEAELRREETLSEGAVARLVVDSLPRGGLLIAGNSLPIRELDVYGGGGKDLLVASQRGTSGIDGVTSGACGAASVADRPGALLVGDISFLHDLSGLWTARHVTAPLALVVVHNGGGRIFEMLPVASHPSGEGVLDHWLTPHSHDLSQAAALFELPFARARTREELRRALCQALETAGVSVIEARVPSHGAGEENRRLASLLERALAS